MSPDTIPAYQPAQDLLAERVILVTGAANGIGRAAAKAYARHGASVVLLDMTEKALTPVYDERAEAGLPERALYALDLASASALDYERLAGQLAAEFGRLDGLLSNAGWVGGLSPLRSHELKRWSQAITVNLHAPFLLCHAL